MKLFCIFIHSYFFIVIEVYCKKYSRTDKMCKTTFFTTLKNIKYFELKKHSKAIYLHINLFIKYLNTLLHNNQYNCKIIITLQLIVNLCN